MLTNEELLKLKALAEQATPGPWKISEWCAMDGPITFGRFGIETDDGSDIAICYAKGMMNKWDADFVAPARMAVPELVDEVLRLSAAIVDIYRSLNYVVRSVELSETQLAEAAMQDETCGLIVEVVSQSILQKEITK